MAVSVRVQARELHGGIAAVVFLLTGAYLHLEIPEVPVWGVASILFFASGAIMAASIVGELGTALQYAVAIRVGRAGASPRTAKTSGVAKIVVPALILADMTMGIAFTWITFRVVYWSAFL